MLLIYTENINKRIEYTFDTIFSTFLRINWKITRNKNDFNSFEMPRLNYSNEVFNHSINFSPYGLLTETGTESIQPDCFKWNNIPVFFKTDANFDCPFDPFDNFDELLGYCKKFELSPIGFVNLGTHFTFMDGTLFDYLKLDADSALKHIENLANEIKKVNGQLIAIWHQSFIADHPEKMKFFKEVAQLLK